MARARTATGETQPFEPEWNPSGYLWNVVHRVAVNVSAMPVAPAANPPAAAPPAPAAYQQSCIGCHEADVISQQRLSRAQWDRELTKMVNWGAKVPSGDREAILDYLVRAYGPRRR
jgi:hypothetical protein